MAVERLADRGRIRALLQADRRWAAYALGDLEPGYFDRCLWLRAGAGLAMRYAGFRPPILFTQRLAADVREILAEAAADHRVVKLSVRAKHLPMLEGVMAVPSFL